MINIRTGVFETNSSSVHTMVICTKEDFQKLRREELLIDDYENLITLDEAKERLLKFGRHSRQQLDDMSREELLELLRDKWIAWTFEDYGEDYEDYLEEYTSPSGDELVIFGYTGRDG